MSNEPLSGINAPMTHSLTKMTLKPAYKPELLLPVGNYEMALAAIHNGADAIYLGFPGFNARGRTKDFSLSDLTEIIELCHLYSVKVNVALNILIFENELTQLIPQLVEVLALKPDALIIQDLGLLRMIRFLAPEQVIHASTQMTVTNHEAMNLLTDLNIQRFVLGRENSLEDIKKIRASSSNEVEVFVHGALCVAYSGQCLTSESLGGRSANRGQCAQSCRLSYEMTVDGVKKNLVDKDYLVSPKDLCGIEDVPALMNLGVKSFKVEGRLKSFDYVATVAKNYRSVMDSVLEQKSLPSGFFEKSKQNMETTYSRGTFSGWLHGVDHQQLVNGKFSAHRGYEFAKVDRVLAKSILLQLKIPVELKPGHGLLFSSETRTLSQGPKPKETGAQIYEVRAHGSDGYEVFFSKDFYINPDLEGATVYLNHDPELKKSTELSMVDRQHQKRIPLSLQVELQLGAPLIATYSDGVNTIELKSEELISLAQKKPLSDEALIEELSALGGSIYKLSSYEVKRHSQSEALFLPNKEIKLLRQKATEKLNLLRSKKTVDGFELQLKSELDAQIWIESSVQKSKKTSAMLLNVLLRDAEQVLDFVQTFKDFSKAHLGTVILDFEFGRDYSKSVEILKNHQFHTTLATTRILKPQEYNTLKALVRCAPNQIMVRNLGALQFLNADQDWNGTLIGDFSLNVTNHLSADYLLSKNLSSICLSYDLNLDQIQDLLKNIDSTKAEITVHQYMPSFHMEHCVFAAFLSTGSSYKDCGKPCEKHRVELKDQFGHHHQIKPDQECRNTMYNAVAQSAAGNLETWQDAGLGYIRYEALYERGEELTSKIKGYLQLLAKERTAKEVISSLRLIEKYGLGDGNLQRKDQFMSRKKT